MTTILQQVVPIVVIVLMSMIITRVATLALTMTGVSRQSARFQARSALTGAGFTTTESESMVNHPVRRRIIMWLMLTGNAGIVSVVGILIVSTSSQLANDNRTSPLLSYTLIVVGIALVLWILGRPRVDRALSRAIRRGLRRYTTLEVRDYEALLEISGGFAISEKLVKAGEWLAGATLEELQLSHEGVLVLGVQRRDGFYLGAPKGNIVVLPGDVLTMYGHQDRLADLDQRPAGKEGQERHEQAVADQEAREQRESREATASSTRDSTLA